MDEAKAMYLGGEVVCAEDPDITVYSSESLGLICKYCGETVYYKSGDINRPHFAHYPSLNPSKYEECLLRQKAKGSFSNQAWWNERDGKQQRLILFQEHFMRFIRSQAPEIDTRDLYLDSQTIVFDKLQAQAWNFARDNRTSFLEYIRIFSKKDTILEREIISEAFEYLIVKGSRNLFKVVSSHLSKDIINAETSDRKIISRDELCCRIVTFLSSINWLEQLSQISQSKLRDKSQKQASTHVFFQKVKNTENLYVYFYKGKFVLGELHFCHIKNIRDLGKIDHRKLLRSNWLIQDKTEGNVRSKNQTIVSLKKGNQHNKRDITSKNKTLICLPRNSRYKSYKNLIEKRFIPRISTFIQDENEHKREIECRIDKKSKLYVSEDAIDLLSNGYAKIFLEDDSNSSIYIADILVKDSAFESKNRYRINSFFIENDEYQLAVKTNPSVEDSVVQAIQFIAKQANHLMI